MNEIKRQFGLIRKVKFIRSKYQQLKLSDWHYKYLLNFFKQHLWFILILIVLLFVQGVIETLLIVFSRYQISNQQKLWLAPFFWQFLIIFLILFFINSYFSIRQEKTLGVWLSNGIRRRLFKAYLDQALVKMNLKKKTDLIAKISYQLPLTSMGVSNSFFGSLRWIIYVTIAVFISYWSGLNWALVLSANLILSAIIMLSAYFVSRRYISQEVTFYSQIIKQIDINTTEKHFLKSFNQEKSVLNQFDRLVDFDSFFRVRRDLWMKMGAKVIFAVLLLLSVFINFFSTGFFSWLKLITPETRFLLIFLLIYFSRAINESLRVGLYLYPARLGMFLTILKNGSVVRRDKTLVFGQTVNFTSRKFKLFKEGVYYSHFKISLARGGRYLFYSSRAIGKTALAELLAGLGAYTPKAVKVKIDNHRIDYSFWQKFGQGICYFDFNFFSEKSLMEFILGKDKETTDFSQIERALKILEINKKIANLVSHNNNFNSSAKMALSSKLSAFSLYALHCLVNEPCFIIIDNAWIDLKYEEIIEILKILDDKLPRSTIIIFSRDNNDYLNYQKKYEMDENFSSEV
ncbi:hypothetical protein CVU82_03700 [Candidatus Falkowbacteria bacterium HGW-Falkowbacteria-1]|jgi:ABC-type multidrug transport system fused ATPase/permease subunit|uniref:ABC transmembrane type-1 domain-containing protein n=1 Tax=Candidatus Falkowbacteria bacterium HGW-Falkowbacteria-1 TaxID=2013768 RepID=A0A2N2E8U1_9BACT|nr:MAG: hypothetical protein CVU82_03700 [Candidatus Falkowbacteria bacterium HGW-Falkowbacteria-1]